MLPLCIQSDGVFHIIRNAFMLKWINKHISFSKYSRRSTKTLCNNSHRLQTPLCSNNLKSIRNCVTLIGKMGWGITALSLNALQDFIRISSEILFMLLCNSITHSLIELNHSWEGVTCAATQGIIPGFYGTRRFITMFTRALHLSLSWARSTQSIPSHPISLRCILILSTHYVLVFRVVSYFLAFPPIS
jgi:hypothetical protein